MNKTELLKARKERILKAIALERPDRTPVILEYAAFAAKVTKMRMSEFVNDANRSVRAMIQTFHMVGGADAINYGGGSNVLGLSFLWMSKVKIPGIDLPEDELWQVDEAELMKPEDYDRILVEGWPAFYQSYIQDRIGGGVWEKVNAGRQGIPRMLEAWAAEGIPVMSGGSVTTPFELYCGGRSLVEFISDLYQIPDKVQAAMDVTIPYFSGPVCAIAKKFNVPCVWVGGWRSASSILSPRLWDRFVFPYFERLVHEIVDAGLIALLHLDSDWTRDLARFRSLPKGKCILALDGSTNIFKAKEILGDHMCIMGDVPPAMFALSTPDEVYNYSMKLIREIGPEGFILHSGCDIPVNAKLENVRAMAAAATG
jgi:uroporphyrinogen-III decarboxylase